MKEKRDFTLERRDRPLTPEKLMNILNQTQGGERAKEVYRNLTGEEPPEETEETNDRTDNNRMSPN